MISNSPRTGRVIEFFNSTGILNAPASGLALAELIVDGQARSVDLSPFSPARLSHD